MKARILYRLGSFGEALKLLDDHQTAPNVDLAVRKRWVEGLIYTSLGDFPNAEKKFRETNPLCDGSRSEVCAGVAGARGTLLMREGYYAEAQIFFEQVVESARLSGDLLWQAKSFLDMSWSASEQTHFDEALDWANAARSISVEQGFKSVAQRALGNMGWAYYKLGDREKAEGMFVEAADQAQKLGEEDSQAGWLDTAGNVYMDAEDLSRAQQSLHQSLALARKIESSERIIDALTSLAFVHEKAGNLGEAKSDADEALKKAEAKGNGRNIVYLRLVEGRVAAKQQDTATAEKDFRDVAKDANTPVFLKWEAERSLARLYEDENQPGLAESEYLTALGTFEAARCSLHDRVDTRLPFLRNAAAIYEDYVHFLISHNRADDALQAADYARARTLTEGLGRSCNATFAPDRLNAPEIARRANGTVLFYMLGEKNSYLWVITPRQSRLFPIAVTKSEMDSAVQAYRKKLAGSPEALENSEDGGHLYQKLVEPAQEFIKAELAKNNNIFIIPDGGLNGLNFETLRPQPKRYWIEDVTITNAASLHLLSAARGGGKNLAGKLLLLGDPVPPSSGPSETYSKLPNTAAQMKNVEKYFPVERKTVLIGEHATPAAYLNSHPERFAYLHFAAHGTANLLNPLDSAIILSRESSSNAANKQDESYRLYAHDILDHPLTADLVTISACNSTGSQTYSGEGLVGLSWAFLRAGAHHVVGALWDVSDEPTPKLFDDFYGEMKKGKSPSYALRAAKLAMLHSGSVHRGPYYWAPFQLYTGS